MFVTVRIGRSQFMVDILSHGSTNRLPPRLPAGPVNFVLGFREKLVETWV